MPLTKRSRDENNTDVVSVKKRDGPTDICSLDRDKYMQKCKGDVKNTNLVDGEKGKQSISEKISTLKEDNEIDSSTRQKDINIIAMTVDELRQELSIRGLSTSGTKKVLVERLSATMDTLITVKVDEQNEKGNGEIFQAEL